MGETLSTVMKVAIAAVIIVGLGAIGNEVYEQISGHKDEVLNYELEE